jgi:hypothetical protein
VSGALLVFATLVGAISVVPGMVGSYWLGQQRRDLMLGFAVVIAVLPVAAAFAAPPAWLLASVTAATALPAAVLALVPRARGASGDDTESAKDRRALLRYVSVGLSIGILSPGSTLIVRGIVGESVSWESAGHLQALWRASDWVAAIAGGVLSVYFLPRLSSAWGSERFFSEVQRSAIATVLPSAIALLLLFTALDEVLVLLYDDAFRLSATAAGLFFGGTLLRIAAWVPLFALFAMRRTLSITLGEFLSLPLFALLLALCADGLTLERAGALWLASYAAFATFNTWAMLRGR